MEGIIPLSLFCARQFHTELLLSVERKVPLDGLWMCALDDGRRQLYGFSGLVELGVAGREVHVAV